MNKIKFYFILLFFVFLKTINIYSQNWLPLNTGVDSQIRSLFSDSINDFLYVGGRFKMAGGDTIAAIAKWNDTNFFSLGCGFDWDCINPLNSFPGPIISIARYNGEIYAGGFFYKADNKPIKNIAKWNEITWDSVGTTFNNDGSITILKVINDELYVGGSFTTIGGISANGLAKWNGLQWSEVYNFPLMFNPNFIAAIEFYKNELYVGGNFQGDSGKIDICRWNGQNWISLNNGFTGANTWVNKLYIWRDTLFIGGYFQKSNGDPGNNIIMWNGNNWIDINDGVMPSNVSDIIEYNNSLYIGGQINSAGGIAVNYIAKWNGEQWCSIGSIFDNTISSFAIFNNELYAAGGFKSINGDTINYIAQWTGGNYTDTCGIINNQSQISNLKSQISISPNPFNNYFTVILPSIGTAAITIYNLYGQIIHQQITNSKKTTINLSSQPSGVYFLRVYFNSQIQTFKIIKM